MVQKGMIFGHDKKVHCNVHVLYTEYKKKNQHLKYENLFMFLKRFSIFRSILPVLISFLMLGRLQKYYFVPLKAILSFSDIMILLLLVFTFCNIFDVLKIVSSTSKDKTSKCSV